MSSNRPSQVETFWQAYVATLPPGVTRPLGYSAWSFGSTPEMADRLGQLVLSGVKTATSSLIWSYAAAHEPLPRAGDLSVIVDGAGDPLCIIETVQVDVIPFSQVNARHAFEEGEGDRSLDYWRRVHWRVFAEECAAIGRRPSEDMPLLCERFRVLYP
jgi:uncharacterized protein YhfF